MSPLFEYTRFKKLPIVDFDSIAKNLYAKAVTDKRIFSNLAIRNSGGHKADLFKKTIDIGGKINSGLGLVLNVTSITNPIGWGLIATNAAARGASSINAEKKMLALDEAAIRGGIALTGTVAAMAFAHNKLARKRTREFAGAIPLGGVYGATAAFKHRKKANKGVARELFAVILWYNAIQGDKVAQRACHALTHGKSTKLLNKFDFPSLTNIDNHNKTLGSKEAMKALGYYETIRDAMKTT